ncbi:MAG: flagellar biosynthesis anti-sigma factor FlgM [Nitrospiraceae bacterium]
MEISGHGRFQELANLLLGVQESDRSSQKARVNSGDPRDQVEISQRAKEIQGIKTRVEQSDTGRSERVEQIRTAIETGTYNMSGQAVADAILRNVLTDAVL